MRKTVMALLALGALGLMSGCGSTGGSDDASSNSTTTSRAPKVTTTDSAAAPVAVDDWAKEFCTSFDAWRSDIATASEAIEGQITVGDAASLQTATVTFFTSASASTQTLISQIEDGGAPDIDDGDELVGDLTAGFEQVDEAAQNAVTATNAQPTEDIASLQKATDLLVAQFQTDVEEVAESFSAIDEDFPSTELSEAITSSCRF